MQINDLFDVRDGDSHTLKKLLFSKVRQTAFYGLKIGYIAGILEHFCIPDATFLIYNKCRTLGNAIHIVEKVLINGVVGSRCLLIEVAEQGEVEVLFFFEFAEGEQRIDRDAVYLYIQMVIHGKVVPYRA